MSSSEKYGLIAVSIHWLTAILVVVTLVMGFLASGSEGASEKITLLRFHALSGGLVFSLFIIRILWWTIFDTKPHGLSEAPAWRRRSSKTVHFLMYVVIIATATVGMIMLIQSDAYAILFFDADAKLPDFWEYVWRLPHGILARIIILLLALHISGALLYALFSRGKNIKRMWL